MRLLQEAMRLLVDGRRCDTPSGVEAAVEMESSFYREHFDSEDRGWWHVGRRRVLRRVLRRALRDAGRDGDGVELLDVGCGTGGTTAFLAGDRSVTGCDVAVEALAYSGRRGIARLVRASAEALPFLGASFDVALVLDVLEHHADDLAVAREVRRVLRPGGVLLATVPAFDCLWGPHDVLVHHERRYRLSQLETVLEAAGFAIRRATYFNALLSPAVLAVQTLRRVLRRGRPAEPASDLPDRMPRAVNALLREIFAAESAWLAFGSLPFGVSALVVASAEETA